MALLLQYLSMEQSINSYLLSSCLKHSFFNYLSITSPTRLNLDDMNYKATEGTSNFMACALPWHLVDIQLAEKLSVPMGHRGSMQYPQQPTIGLYPELVQFIPNPHPYSSTIPSNTVLPDPLRPSNSSFFTNF